MNTLNPISQPEMAAYITTAIAVDSLDSNELLSLYICATTWEYVGKESFCYNKAVSLQLINEDGTFHNARHVQLACRASILERNAKLSQGREKESC